MKRIKPKLVSILAAVVGLTISIGVSNINQSQAQSDSIVQSDSAALICPKCKGTMEAGVMLDYWNGSDAGSQYWGTFVRKNFPFSKKPREIKVTANRCTNCGYLELYAK